MSSENRLARINELMKRELGLLCEREGIATVAGGLATITSVRVTPDLRQADVSVSVFGSDAARAEVIRLLLHHRKELQSELARRVILKFTPVLRFHEDRAPERADRILHILDELGLPNEAPDKPAADKPTDDEA